MAKYKVGDKVRIVSERPRRCWNPEMDKYLGKTMTIMYSGINGLGVYYCMNTDGVNWHWYENMIAGLAEPKKPEFSVSVHFHDRLTVAELIKDGKVVKVENARCNPKDKYSMAEGARIAVERLFQKQVSANPTIHIGDKVIVTGNSHSPRHYFPKGTVVTAIGLSTNGYINCQNGKGLLQAVRRRNCAVLP